MEKLKNNAPEPDEFTNWEVEAQKLEMYLNTCIRKKVETPHSTGHDKRNPITGKPTITIF